jgi:hypothetical protein
MTWASIRLDLARNGQFPAGSSTHGYLLHAPLSAGGNLDLVEYERSPARAVVEEYWGNGPTRRGRLTRTSFNLWSFSFDKDGEEPIFQFGRHRLLPGDYLTVRIASGENQTFRVSTVVRATEARESPRIGVSRPGSPGEETPSADSLRPASSNAKTARIA